MCLVASQFVHDRQERYIATADDWNELETVFEEMDLEQAGYLGNGPISDWICTRMAELKEQVLKLCENGRPISDIDEEIVEELNTKIAVFKSELKILL